jgi:hypothetical protein
MHREHILCQIDPDGSNVVHDFPFTIAIEHAHTLQSWHSDARSGRGSPLHSLGAMKLAILLLGVAVAALVGEWAYRTFLRPVEPLSPQVITLAQHLSRSGVPANARAVRHGFRHSQVTSTASLELKDFPLPLSVAVCPTEQAAEATLTRVRSSPNLLRPRRIGNLVTYLPTWGEDSGAMIQRVEEALDSYAAGT